MEHANTLLLFFKLKTYVPTYLFTYFLLLNDAIDFVWGNGIWQNDDEQRPSLFTSRHELLPRYVCYHRGTI